MGRGRPRHPDVLTPREWQVLDLMGEGLTNAEIAVRIRVSPETVKTHVAQILAKLEVGSRREAVAWASTHERSSLFGLLPMLSLKHAAVAGGTTLVVLSALLAIALVTRPSPGSAGGKLAFIQDGNLWVQEMPDGVPVQLTSHGRAWAPVWSPSGDWIAEGGVEGSQSSGLPSHALVMRTDGSQPRYASGCYAWSPVEDLLLCTTGRLFWTETPEGNRRSEFNLVDVVKAASGKDITGGVCYVWRPDGSAVACHVFGEPFLAGTVPMWYSGLWTVELDGANPRELHAVEVSLGSGSWLIAAGWAEDSDEVLFIVTNPSTSACWLYDCYTPDATYYRVASSGHAPQEIIGASSLPGVEKVGAADWVMTAGTGPETWTDKRIVSVHGRGNTTFLTDPDRVSFAPALSPDGDMIAYVAAPDYGVPATNGSPATGPGSPEIEQAKAGRRIWLMNRDGSGRRQLTDDDQYRDERPMWTSDGEHVAFLRLDAQGRTSVWLTRADGSDTRRIADVSFPEPGSRTARNFAREDYLEREFDYYGQIPQWLLYSWWHGEGK